VRGTEEEQGGAAARLGVEDSAGVVGLAGVVVVVAGGGLGMD